MYIWFYSIRDFKSLEIKNPGHAAFGRIENWEIPEFNIDI